MAYRRRRSTRRFAKRRFARGGRRKRVSKAAVKRVVKSVLSREEEVKARQTKVLSRALYYPAQGALYDSNNTVPLSPSAELDILQGVGNGARVGVKIRCKRLTWNAVFHPNPYSPTSNINPQPQMVKVVIFYERSDPSVTPVPRTDFFEFNNSEAPILGEITDMVAPIDQKYRVLTTRTFKLGYAEYSGTGSTPDRQAFANNDFKMNYVLKMDLTKYLPKLIRFRDNSVAPISRGLWAQVMVAPADGGTGLSGNASCQLQYWTEIKYTDA